MPDLKKMLTLEALSAALPSWLKRSTKPDYNADEIDTTLTVNQFVTASDKQNWNAKGTYSKPSGGIPKSDLTNAVQTSLGKADTALQSFTETDPTVPSWAKQTNKPSYTQDEVSDGSTYKRVSATEKTTWNNKGTYSKPSGGIPKTDLASAVQTSLGKADTALQSFTETDPTVPSWAKASSKPTYTASEVGAIATSAKGAASGVAELDSNGKVPSSQLPAYVDDVLEYSAKSSFPSTGETGKIYVDTSTNKTYRWSGSAYVEISASLALGETSSTAYRGDRGKTAYTHSQTTSGNPHNVTKSDVGLGNVGNFKAVSTVASQGLSSTEQANARANIGAGTGNGTYSKPSGGIPKSDLASAVQTSLGLADSALQSFTETDPTVPAWAKQSSKPSYTYSEVGAAPASHSHGNITNAGALQTTDVAIANGDKLVVTDASNSNKVARTSTSFDGSTTTQALTKKGTFETFPLAAYGTCDTAADVAAKVVTLASDSKFTLVPGSIVAVLSTYTNTAQNPTLNVNGTGAKPIVYGTAVIETTNLSYATYANRQHLFIYDGTNYIYLTHNTDANTTYTNASLGQGYGTCTTAASTAAKAVTLSSYALTTGGIVSVKFSYDVPASATMNVNSKGAKAIYYRGAAITAGIIKAGDTATFIYSTYYHLISIDRDDNTTYSSKSAASGGTDVSLCTTGEKYTWNNKGTYSKPSGGIPKSDLASAVQTSLGKADTALQSFTESDPTVPSWAKQSSKPSYTASEVGAAASSHTHGNIQNGGTLQTNDITIASGDKLVVTDSSDSSKIARASISFDGSTTTQALTKAGSWQTFNNYTHPTDGANTGSFGPSASVSPGFGGTFSVPYVTVNAKGHVTAASSKTITMPNFTATPYTQPTKHSNITAIDSGGYIQIGKLVIVNMRFTVGTACGQYTDLFTDLPLPLTPLSGGSACVACSSNNNTLMICANGRMQNYDSGSLAAGVYVVSTVYIGQ